MYLSISDISKTFQQDKNPPLSVFHDINIAIQQGEFVSLLGPSGCGKSTLLSIIAGLSRPSTGKILLENKAITAPGPDKSMVFQESALFPWMTVNENVTFPLRKKMNKKERAQSAASYLKMVHLSKFADHYPHELSGGMQQRVSIARALAMNAKLLLMDEPFGALDEQTRIILQEELERIWLETEKTIIFVTHSIREAIKLSDRVIIMGARPGTVISDFKVDLPRPRLQQDMAELEEEVLKILKVEIDKVMKEELQYAGSD
ncbi:NitT/TauT family transport system ATP-binding protein [Virgibacillus halotolerans]|uniref:ATP-binding cassette domain-containing protein n=1 Tax=Virgibacillus halotolerans TaxID=1071053 RepID=UPI0019614108|nr:NitT/TauT family transport system ATP-binding protein [Virgibacillus halotolerans]